MMGRPVCNAAAYNPLPMSRVVTVRAAESSDLDWLVDNDEHLDADTLTAKVAACEVLVAEVEGERAGLLRFDRLWSAVPFVAQVRVGAAFRRRGIGRALVDALADEGRASGASYLLSSATGNEQEPQAWHQAVGFTVCGELAGINDSDISEVFYRLPL